MRHLTKIILVAILSMTCVVSAGQQSLLRQQQEQVIIQNEVGSPHISRSMFTTRIANNEPVSNLNEIETAFRTVFFFTELKNCNGCKIIHKWSHNGTPQVVVEGYSKWPIYRFWSSVNLTPTFVGTWTVDVSVEGQPFAQKSFTYYKESQDQKGNQGIQQRLELKSVDECEENLRYFSDQAKDDPNEPYFQFMLEKWGKRCLK